MEERQFGLCMGLIQAIRFRLPRTSSAEGRVSHTQEGDAPKKLCQGLVWRSHMFGQNHYAVRSKLDLHPKTYK